MFFGLIRFIFVFLLHQVSIKIRYNKFNMQGKGKSKDDTQLPKIRSQIRIHTASDRRNTEQDKADKALANRPLSNNCRTKSLRTFATKTVKYESTGNVYNKKIEDIERQTYLVDSQIKSAEEQIKVLRQNIGSAKKQPGMSRLNESSASYFSKISVRKNTLLDHETVKSELKNLQAKILNYRNKIDGHLEKNKAIQQQIDTYRKEISTLKIINNQLEHSFKSTSQKYEEQMELSRKLDAQIGQKTDLTYRKKVDNMHQKAQMIKQYDVILKTLDKKLTSQQTSTGQEEKSQFYLTDIINRQIETQRTIKGNEKPIRQIFSGKKPKINQIRQKLKNYQQQFEQLKAKVGSQNIEEITKKFTEEYQKNFHQYNFINEIYREYEETIQQQFQLLQKKNQLLKQLQAEKSTSKVKEIYQLRSNIQKMNQKKEKIKKDMQMHTKLALEIKVYLGQFMSTMQKNSQINPHFQELTDKTVAQRLHEIYEKYSKELGLINSQNSKDRRQSKNYLPTGKQGIDDLIDQVKKQGEVSKDNRLLTREELQKNTIQLKQKKMESSLSNQPGTKFKTKKEIEKNRMQHAKKPSR